MIELTLEEFSNQLAAKQSMPGGGSAAAYTATMASNLASMVANFTTGKKKYSEYEEDIQEILIKTEVLNKKLLALVDEDAEAFLNFMAAYKNKAGKEVIQGCLKDAARAPMEVIRLATEVVDIHEELLTKGSKMLISDVGVGVALLKSAIASARLNVLINLREIEDEVFVGEYMGEMNALSLEINEKCDRIYYRVEKSLERD